MTADRRDARLVLPGEWILVGEGSPFPRAFVGTPHRVHHVEVLPADGGGHEVALCLLQRGAHPGHTAEDERAAAGAPPIPFEPRVHPVNTPLADAAVRPDPWPILWMPVGSTVEVVPPPPRVSVVWDGSGWVIFEGSA